MARRSTEDTETLDPTAVEALVDAFARTAGTKVYSVAQLPKTEELARIKALPTADQSSVAAELVRRIGALLAAPPSSNGQLPFYTQDGAPLAVLLGVLLRKRLLHSDAALARLLDAPASGPSAPLSLYPLAAAVAALERRAEQGPLPADLAAAGARLAATLGKTHGAANVKLAARVHASLSGPATKEPSDPLAPGAERGRLERILLSRTTFPEPAPFLLDALNATKVMPAETDADGAVSFGSPSGGLAFSAPVLDAINRFLAGAPSVHPGWRELAPMTATLTAAVAAAGGRGVATAAAALGALGLAPIRNQFGVPRAERFRFGCEGLLQAVEGAFTEIESTDAASLREICHALSRLRPPEFVTVGWQALTSAVVAHAARSVASDAGDDVLLQVLRFRERLARADSAGARGCVRTLDRGLSIGTGVELELGERWSDQAFADLRALEPAERALWLALLEHGTTVKGTAPNAKWTAAAQALLAGLSGERIERLLRSWFALAGRPRPQFGAGQSGGRIGGRDSSVPTEHSADVLRGLAFVAGLHDAPWAARALGDLAMACFKMVPGVGARCIRPGTAALASLAKMTTKDALGQLCRLRQLVKFGTAKKMLDASLERLAQSLGVTPAELHELAAPDFDLDARGRSHTEAGEFTLEIEAHTGGATLRVLDADGNPRKSVPAAVKSDHAEAWQAAKQAAADIDQTLEGQRARLDAMFVEGRFWGVPAWRERYVEHPLVGVLGRRLVWRVVDDVRTSDPGSLVLWRDDRGAFCDLAGERVDPRADQHVRLWHPIEARANEVAAWRDLIEALGYRQPVKQAHREVYPLTDAERGTETYSNRFASHVLGQHAFQKLAAERGWTSQLRLLVDASYAPPTRELPNWGLRAEFWVESLGDQWGRDTTESGSFLYLTTDQVRFYRSGAAQVGVHGYGGGYAVAAEDIDANRPLRLDRVPALVFSEMMRDVDLFVGGASVGTNPDWEDGGPEGRFRDYWREYGFGALTGSGTARRELLLRLVPRLAIAEACEIGERWLVVRGKLRAYKIHLGSGNILMGPNDQYLCIVPSQRDRTGSALLPFEGDRTLSIILSKALLLAEDDRITDQTIARQIRG